MDNKVFRSAEGKGGRGTYTEGGQKALIEILGPKPAEQVYDPGCGSGGVLIGAYDDVNETHGKRHAWKLFLFGQEANLTALALCKINLYIHDIRDAQVEYGDTLRFPKPTLHIPYKN